MAAFFDVVVVGGGLVGAATAAALKAAPACAGLRVALVDARTPPSSLSARAASEPALRVSTVTPASRAFVSRTKAWDAIAATHAAPFHDMQVWDADGAFVRFTADDAAASGAVSAGEPMAHVVENDVLASALLDAAMEAGVEPLWPSSLVSLELPAHDAPRANEPARLVLRDAEGAERRVNTSLVVAADGQRSQARALARLRYEGGRYRDQVGAVFTLALDAPVDTAFQKFLPTGPLALLPVRASSDGAPRANVVWSTTAAHAAELCGLGEDALAAAANAALAGGPAPAALSAVGVARSFPLSACVAPRLHAPRLVLAGDAARAVHPLAGQGANLGFADARAVVDTASRLASGGLDLGDGSAWRSYSRLRVSSGAAWCAALECLRFTYASAPLSSARALGVGAVASASPLRRLLVAFASGSVL